MKKTEYITFRTDQSTKTSLQSIASEKKWTISLLVEEVIQKWLQTQKKQDE